MNNPHQLSPTSLAILEQMMNYHADRLALFERDQSRRRRAEHMDGDYNLPRALLALADCNLRDAAPYEQERSEGIAKEIGVQPEPGYVYIPYHRDLTTSVAGAGGYLVSPETGPGDLFVQGLYAASVVNALGVLRVPIQGDSIVPAISTNFTAYWLANQAAQITESNAAFSVGASTPKHAGVYFEISRQLLLQMSRTAQQFVFGEGGNAAAAEVDSKILSGSGVSGQPMGLLSASGIGSVVGTSFTWAKACDMMNTVEDANGLVYPNRAAWVLAPDVAKLLRQREKATGSGFILVDGSIGDYRALVTKSVPNGTAIFGDWSGIAVLDWARLQIGADPYGVNSALFTKSLVGVRALWSMDLAVLRAKSFCKSESIT